MGPQASPAGPWEPSGSLRGLSGDAKDPTGGPSGALEDPQRAPKRGLERKVVKNVVLYALLKGSWRGPREAKVRIAFTIKRFGGYEGKSIRKQMVFDGSGGALGAPQGRPRGDLVRARSIYYCNLQ